MSFRNEIAQIDTLRKKAAFFRRLRIDYIKPFYNSDQNLFSYTITDDGKPEQGLFLSSTATCVLILKHWNSLESIISNKALILSSLLNNPWKTGDLPEMNAYTTSLVLPALDCLGVDSCEAKVKQGLEQLRTTLQKGGGAISLFEDFAQHTKSAFVTWWALKSLECFGWLKDTEELALALNWAETEVYKQIAFFTSGEVDSKNVYQLAFAWAICESFGSLYRLRRKVSDYVLELIFSDQKEEGVWPFYYPLFHFPKVGSAFVYHFELMWVVLAIIQNRPMLLRPYLKNVDRLLTWVETRKIEHPSGVNGWSITTDPKARHKPISWATIEVLEVLRLLEDCLACLEKELIYFELTGRATNTKTTASRQFSEVVDIEIPNESASVKQILERHIIAPIKSNGATLAGIKDRVALTILLYGPPGTSKTTLARAVASDLGWPIAEIDPSHFTPRGSIGFERKVLDVFSQLENLFDTVILLDEMDELIRERKSASSDRIGRFLTTLMLPRLTRLRDLGKTVVFVNTNHAEDLDVAAIRYGRFDMLLPIGPPMTDGKLGKLAEMLGISKNDADQWWSSLDPDRCACFEKILFGELGSLVRAMGVDKNRDGFSRALGAINDALYLNMKSANSENKTNWQEYEATLSLRRLL